MNSVDNSSDRDVLIIAIQRTEHAPFMLVPLEKITCVVDSLPVSKAVGINKIPLEFYSKAPMIVLTGLVMFINNLLICSFVLVEMSDVMIIPILKSNLKDSTVSEN